MAPLQIQPASGPLDATITVPGSKSLTNRALICAALAAGESTLENASDSDDTALTANGLNQLGVLVRRQESLLRVAGTGGRLYAPRFPIPVENAGTAFRFMVSLAALARGRTTFMLSPRMAERPVEDLVDALRQAGVAVTRDVSGLHVHVDGGTMGGGTVRIRADRSSQFLSSLLMAAPYAGAPLVLSLQGGLLSGPYVAMTLDVMRAFGVAAGRDAAGDFRVPQGARYRPTVYRVEADASGASYPLAAAAIAGGRVEVPGLGRESVQGDAAFVQLLGELGCAVEHTGRGVAVRGGGRLQGIDVDMHAMPDLVPTLVAVALFAAGTTRIRNVAHLRFKESNRLETLAAELQKLGAGVTVQDDGLVVEPGPLHGAVLSVHDDHRLAMSFALIGLKVPGVVIDNPACVRKSFPGFWEQFTRLSGVRR